MTSEALERMDASAVRRFVVLTRAALAAHRTEIDALNVFPVPDGDTGTNLYLTLDTALDSVLDSEQWRDEPSDLGRSATALAQATLLAARGNSGVILSQLVRGFAEVVAAAPDAGLGPPELARAVRRAADLARASVTRPAEGTILSVADAAAAAAERLAAQPEPTLMAVTEAALHAGRAALAATTGQLAALAEAGVVDAGGAGFVLVLESLQRVVAGEVPDEPRRASRPQWRPQAGTTSLPGGPTRDVLTEHAPQPGGPAYEVMYLLDQSTPQAARRLRARLDALGDSVLVVGGPQLWNVHAHVDDPGAAIEAGVAAGRPRRIVVSSFDERLPPHGERPAPTASTAVVACPPGPGLARLFALAGATVVLSAPGRRASAGELLDAVRSACAQTVVLLPDDPDLLLAARAAADLADAEQVVVEVLPTRSPAQGIAAMAVFDPADSPADNLRRMAEAAAATRYGAVAVAVRAAVTEAGACAAGDALASVEDRVVAVEGDVVAAAGHVVAALLGGTSELVTLVLGQGAPAGLADAVAASLPERVEVNVVDGGQPHYQLLLGVE
ncbi:MAG TPA: DAK2 domain-containing protein [Dermatophilaceae bacterium]|nr:DAK2 domain-containing protein [Dermatophilaceae bacterium]